MKKELFLLAFCIVLVYCVGFFGSIFTSQEINSPWYQQIKPAITPPNWVFPIVWNILFLLIAISLFIALLYSDFYEKFYIAAAFGANFAFNILWSFFYFDLQNPRLAFYDLILLWFSIIWMIFVTWRINKKASWLLIPYLLWVSFAGVLNWLSF